MDFEKICMIFTMQEPFYGILLSAMERVPKPSVGTIGVGRSGNVFKLYYNPDFISKLSVDATLVVLKHEVLHCAFNHFTIWEDNDVPPSVKEMRNIAADMEVNSYLDISKLNDIHPVLAKDFGWENKLGTREYYSRLEALCQPLQQMAAQMPTMPCNGGQNGQSSQSNGAKPQQSKEKENKKENNAGSQGQQSQQNNNTSEGTSGDKQQDDNNPLPEEYRGKFQQIDTHDEWPDSAEATTDNIQQVIDDLLDFAAAEVEKACGTIPGEMVGRIEKIRKKPKPVADWKRFFRRYLGNEFTEFIKKSKKRESRRFPDAAGNRHRRKSHILVAIDTSGSVSMPEYMEFMGQIKTLTASASFRVLECDARIQHEYEFRGKISQTLHGGGGTSFQPVVDYFNNNRRIYDALIYFTDGYCSVPKDTPKDTLWVISSKGTKDRAPFRVNGASVVIIPSKN
ncbi:MAG: hypothetical protein II661_04830, partial [Bacteroidales bacterium]|nr:hypothetical protein [Bacteroidales bacterium]